MSHTPLGSPDATRTTASPGPPRKVFELRSWSTLLWVLALLAGVVAAQSCTADYWGRLEAFPLKRPPLFRYPWLDTRAAMTALVSMLGLAIARANLALGLRPYLSYSNITPKVEDKPPRFIVLLRNEGTGPAVIAYMKYEIRFQGDDFELILEHETVVDRLEANCGLKEGNDYKLTRFSSGATIGKDKERNVLEVNNDAIDRLLKLRDFEIKVQYRGLLGDLYEKTVHCLPRADYRRPRSLPLAS